MPSVFANLVSVCASVVAAFFVLQKVCALHTAYQLRSTRIENETWLRDQCASPEFYTNMRYHTNLCEEVEATARIGAASKTRPTGRIRAGSNLPSPGPQTTPRTRRGPKGTSTKSPSPQPPSGDL